MSPDDPRHGTVAGYRAHATDGERPCQQCREAKNAYNRANPRSQRDFTKGGYDPNDGLGAGEWVASGTGTMVWKPAGPRPIGQSTDSIIILLACPTCHAQVGRHCVTKTGRHRTPHGTRIVSRRCQCGGALDYGKQLCPECRAAARRENGRIGMRNTRARRKAAA